ncbi:hypothetical protein [Virgibacillus proomii]|uniref:hypothetical protein n=1 Tax=Virgibacillus proomii TaxID=84407 RepID=UPI001C0FA291|nr:hypothetical protein [Virgibacillus proomii]MBU5266291.1 hypothetical protein [Virgibacillus proomii]
MALTENEVKRINVSMPVANDLKIGDILKQLQESTGGEVTVTWADVKNKPSEFAPSAHTHVIADVKDLQAGLDSKLESVKIDDVAGLQAELNSKLESVAVADVSGLKAELDGIKSRLDALEGGGA